MDYQKLVVAVRTSTDYVNHQNGQLELLSAMNEYRQRFSPQRNLRQNQLLAFVAGALGLAPSYDVFISNRDHPEGFANPHAARDALTRALSAGVVGVGDKLGCLDPEILSRLAFPDGSLAQPDHPPHPVASLLQSNTPAFSTETVVSGYTWTYLTLFNLSEDPQDYTWDLGPAAATEGAVVYDYHAAAVLAERVLTGRAAPGEGRYLIVAPSVAGMNLLGFPDKYVTLPGRQVRAIETASSAVVISLDLPPGREYTFAAIGGEGLSAEGRSATVTGVETAGALTGVRFRAESRRCSLVLKP